MQHVFTNSLINESSPYLLQHAHNPVNWYAWNEETLAKAKAEDKLILVSIGYSACHWCHVMEHESFEDEQVAALMNEHFVCIKIDREERPDIDQVYMAAVQIMTGQGGWPLNCFALPDGRPIYGGTYFPKQKWMSLLQNIANLFINDRNRAEQYASELTEGLLKAEQLMINEDPSELSIRAIERGVEKWASVFDKDEGGTARAPKFPLPGNYDFLLQYASLYNDSELLKHLHLTLKKMAFGGIYDQLGGGFARYSVDALWKVPHFEKMLYDNAQLISLYAKAYAQSGNELYKNVVVDTIRFVKRELSHADGNLYSALDADSEGVEGKFYVWTKEDIEMVLEADTQVFWDFYEVNKTGYWEHDNYILLRKQTEKEFCLKYQIEENRLKEILDRCKKKLMDVRDKRVRPGLDDKTLCSWNALMAKAFADAYKVLGDVEYLEDALKTANFIRTRMTVNGKLMHSYKNGLAKINGFLEDYAFVIEAYIKLYEITSDNTWLADAKALTEVVLNDFNDTNSPFFYFNSAEDAELIVRKLELSDNVIPASNSQMALNLYYLDKYLNQINYRERAESMVRMVQEEIMHYLPGYSNWASLACNVLFPFKEVVIIGEKAEEYYKELVKHYSPNALYTFSRTENDLPLFEGRFVKDKTLIYVCVNNACLLPVESVKEAKALLVNAS